MLNEGKHTGEFLLSEANGHYSRDKVTIVANSGDLVPGTLLGKITASGKYKPYNNANADGSEVAKAVLYRHVPTSAADQPAVVVARAAEVLGTALVGNDAPGTADLAAVGIIVR
jgi:hypothetical protein